MPAPVARAPEHLARPTIETRRARPAGFALRAAPTSMLRCTRDFADIFESNLTVSAYFVSRKFHSLAFLAPHTLGLLG
jgi:hypothetical protein